MSGVPKVALADLQLPASCVASAAYATAAEKLAVGLSRNSGVVLVLPQHQAAALKTALAALLDGSTRSLPGCEVREWRIGGPPEEIAIEQAYGMLESAGRLVLSALCRSSLLRLRADTFSGMLDDLPLSRSVQGSSGLAAQEYVDNFSHLSTADGASVMPLFADPQDAVSERGLLSLFYCLEAREPAAAGGNPLSAMQIQDSRGQWQDVQLGSNEVVVLLGHTMQHATAGLLRPGVHRVVGAPYGSGRRSKGRSTLHFELRPRSAALLDLRAQLEAAGHSVSVRFSPVSVSSLLEQFESLLSPATKVATPAQQQGAAAHAAWEELQESLKKGKKRVSALGTAEGPADVGRVTRSAAVRRSGEGLAHQQRPSSRSRQRGGQAGATSAADEKENGKAGGGEGMEWDGQQAQQRRRSGASSSTAQRPTSAGEAGTSSSGFSLGAACTAGTAGATTGGGRQVSMEPASSAALAFIRGRTCSLVDGCLADDPAQCLTVCIRSFTGLERWFYVSASKRLGAVFEVYCARLGISLGAVKFLLRGERVFGASTPESIKMLDGAELTAVPESCDRLQQQRELGPMFSAVLGAAGAGGSLADLL